MQGNLHLYFCVVVGVGVVVGFILVCLGVAFIYWLFTSKNKVKDIQKATGFLERLGDKIDEFGKDVEHKSKEYAKRVLKEEYKKAKEIRILENKQREKQGLTPLTLEEYFRNRPEYAEISLEDISHERQHIAELQRRAQVKKEYLSLKAKFETIKKTRQASLPSLTIESFFGYNPEYLELALKDYPATVKEIVKPIDVDIEINKLPSELVEFIYIRYYLTGLKTLPQIKCIYDSWAKTSYAKTELNEEVWGKIIEQISFDATKRKMIDGLYHFTHKDNLPSILSKGLLTKKTLEDQKIEYKYNDKQRWDKVIDSISLSISRPHHKMFMKYAKPTGMHNWVILKISPTLLTSVEDSRLEVFQNYDYIDKTVFNKFNAASFAMKNLTIEERKSHKAFLDMFESNIGKTLETFTFDNQAEILYLGNIPSEFIEEIQVIEENDELSWVSDLGFKLCVNTTVLEKR